MGLDALSPYSHLESGCYWGELSPVLTWEWMYNVEQETEQCQAQKDNRYFCIGISIAL